MPTVLRSATLTLCALRAGGALALGLGFFAAAPALHAQTATAAAPSSRLAASKPGAAAAPKPSEAKPEWAELTPPQKLALAPLAGSWATLSESHKRKWLALSQNFPRLPASEQVTLHSRMTEWAALSPKQRAQARLNFGETKRLGVDDKKAKWEAYQALPAEEKKRLAADAQSKPPSPAAALKPVPRQKLAVVPPQGADAKSPRIAAGPSLEADSPAMPSGRPAPAPARTP